MPHPRCLVRLATLVVAALVTCGVPAAADAATWSVPRTTASAVGAGTARVSSDALEDALMVRINEVRAAHGLRKIWSFDACTDGLSEQWGERIARTGIFEHRDQNEVIRRCNNSWAGEALVRGVGLTPDVMVQLWMNSPSHREILLSPRARRAGVSIAQDSQGRVIGVLNLVRHT